jgi:hypothetical protein
MVRELFQETVMTEIWFAINEKNRPNQLEMRLFGRYLRFTMNRGKLENHGKGNGGP